MIYIITFVWLQVRLENTTRETRVYLFLNEINGFNLKTINIKSLILNGTLNWELLFVCLLVLFFCKIKFFMRDRRRVLEKKKIYSYITSFTNVSGIYEIYRYWYVLIKMDFYICREWKHQLFTININNWDFLGLFVFQWKNVVGFIKHKINLLLFENNFFCEKDTGSYTDSLRGVTYLKWNKREKKN